MPKQYTLHQISKKYSDLILNNNIVGDNLLSGFSNVVQIGIQTLPGTKVQLNNNFSTITVGETGIFELDLLDRATQIDSLIVVGVPTPTTITDEPIFLLNFLREAK